MNFYVFNLGKLNGQNIGKKCSLMCASVNCYIILLNTLKITVDEFSG